MIDGKRLKELEMLELENRQFSRHTIWELLTTLAAALKVVRAAQNTIYYDRGSKYKDNLEEALAPFEKK